MKYMGIGALLIVFILELEAKKHRLIPYNKERHGTAIQALLHEEKHTLFLNARCDEYFNWADEYAYANINHSDWKTRVREKDNELLGFIAYSLQSDEGRIILLGVKSHYRRKKHGTHMLATIVKRMKKQGMKTISLKVRCDNKSALHFYEKNGFIIDHTQNNIHYLRYEDI